MLFKSACLLLMVPGYAFVVKHHVFQVTRRAFSSASLSSGALKRPRTSRLASAEDFEGELYSSRPLKAAPLGKEDFQPPPSPIIVTYVRDRRVLVKRDDLYRLPNTGLCGNKARKLWTLSRVPVGEFPPEVVSYGGPQSNSMLALAAVVQAHNTRVGAATDATAATAAASAMRGIETDLLSSSSSGDSSSCSGSSSSGSSSDTDDRTTSKSAGAASSGEPSKLVYYTKTLPRWLRQNPSGNYARALALGTEVRQLPPHMYQAWFGHLSSFDENPPPELTPPLNAGALWVPQGGACGGAEEGVQMLAEEIANAWFGDSATGQPSAKARATSVAQDKAETAPELVANKRADDSQPSLPPLSDPERIITSTPLPTTSPSPSPPRAMAAVAAATAEGQSLVAKLRRDGGQSQRLAVVLPGGTGATALFLARHLQPRGIQVCVVPCVGDGDGKYLTKQMKALDAQTGGLGELPYVLRDYGSNGAYSRANSIRGQEADLQKKKKISPRTAPFGEPRIALLDTWRELQEDSDLYVDLLYGARAWEVLLKRWTSLPPELDGSGPMRSALVGANEKDCDDDDYGNKNDDGNSDGRGFGRGSVQLMYLHCGGLEGTSSQLNRYKHAKLVGSHELM